MNTLIPKIITLLSKNLFLVCCGFIVLLPLFWIPKGFVYTSEEPNFINYDIKLDRASSMWTRDGGFGSPGDPSNQSLLIPNAVFYASSRALGFDGSVTQKLYISFIFLSICISFGLFSSLFSKSQTVISFGLLIYLFNFYTVSSLGYTAKMLQLILMPAIFFVTYRYLETRKIRYVLQNFVWIFIFQGVFTNLPLALTSFFIYPVSAFYFLLIENKWKIKSHLVQMLILILSTIPVVMHHYIIYLTVLVAMKELPNLFTFTAVGAPLNLLIQLRGVWWEKSGHLYVDYFPLWRFYSYFAVVIISFAGALTVLFSSLEQARDERFKIRAVSIFWLLFYLFGVGLASGLYFLPGLYQWLMDHIPLMVMFREPWAKFVPYVVISLSGMTLVTLDYLLKTNRKKYLFISLLLTIYLCVQGYPFISGKIIDSEVAMWKHRLVKIPNYWEDYSSWTNANQKTVLPLPFGSSAFNSKYNWYKTDIGNSVLQMPCQLAKTNVICDNNQDRFASIFRFFVKAKNFDPIVLGGIDFVLLQEDLDTSMANGEFDWQREAITPFIEDIPVATFGGKLTIFPVKEKYLRPKVYATQDILFVEKYNSVSDILLRDFGKEKIFIYSDSSVPKIDKTVTPKTTFTKITQTDYRVRLENASKPFILVFNESYDLGWKITGFDRAKHILVNGYANGWYISPNLSCTSTPCEINFSVRYSPQQYFSATMIVNIVIFIVSTFSLVIIFITKLVEKSDK